MNFTGSAEHSTTDRYNRLSGNAAGGGSLTADRPSEGVGLDDLRSIPGRTAATGDVSGTASSGPKAAGGGSLAAGRPSEGTRLDETIRIRMRSV